MVEKPETREAHVVVDEDSVLARWADWQGRAKQVPVAAIAGEDEAPMMFVSNEVLVGADDRDLAAELVHMGAAVVPQLPLRPPPHGMERHELTGEFPMPVRLQFAEPPRVERASDTLTELYRRHDAARGTVTVTSEGAARVASLVARLVADGRQIGLNALGDSAVMPLASAQEGAGDNPFAWPAFSGRSRIVQAWQLVESVRAVASVEPVVWIAILDGGFWLDAAGVPLVAGSQAASDFGGGVPQINLLDETGANASGTNPNKCGSTPCPWHGNAVASAAVAAVNNMAGAAGSGGTVGRPILLPDAHLRGSGVSLPALLRGLGDRRSQHELLDEAERVLLCHGLVGQGLQLRGGERRGPRGCGREWQRRLCRAGAT